MPASLAAGQTIAHYRLLAPLGEGGMGVVWKAQDVRLDRPVALKFLPADVATDPERRKMFLEEARLASSLSDARIAQVYDLGREGDLDYIAMECVEGKSLDKVLHGRPLPLDQVVALGLQIAQALSRAHRHGLLHRDIKPANVIVTPDGDVKVVDFGVAAMLARAAEPAAPAESTRRPQVPGGDVVGTLAYMPPEQVRGEALDARSDIYALGVTLYEMTTGHRPHAGATQWEVMESIFKGRPRPVHELVPQVPVELERIVLKALAPKAAERYQTTDDLAVDLKRLQKELDTDSSPSYTDLRLPVARHGGRRWRLMWALGAAVVLAGAAVLGFWRHAGPDPHTVVVMPFEVQGQARGADYAGRTFGEAIAVNLALAQGLTVLPVPDTGPSSSRGAPARAELARRLGAGRYLTGLLARSGDSVKVSVNLLESGQGSLLWGTHVTSGELDLGACAAGIARAVTGTLSVRVARHYDYVGNLTGSPAMLDSPLLPRALAAVRNYDLPVCDSVTRELCAIFPGEADAHVLRIWTLLGMHVTRPRPELRAQLRDELSTLHRLDPDHPFIDIARAIQARYANRYAEAVQILGRVLARDDLTPAARSHVLRQRSSAYSLWGKVSLSIADAEAALRLDPTHPQCYEQLSRAMSANKRYGEALLRAQQGLAISPNHPALNQLFGLALMDLGRVEEAVEPLAKACELTGNQSECGDYAVVLQLAGHAQRALEAARHAESLPESQYGQYNLAQYWSLSGNKSRALACLRKALDLGMADVDFFVQHNLDPLRNEREFQRVAAEVKKRLASK
jgi:tetratricopeptide (TPR) repeat protein/TolB-like protein/predicted Ser/Thr protein kinase